MYLMWNFDDQFLNSELTLKSEWMAESPVQNPPRKSPQVLLKSTSILPFSNRKFTMNWSWYVGAWKPLGAWTLKVARPTLQRNLVPR